jgi:hypothetical protein
VKTAEECVKMEELVSTETILTYLILELHVCVNKGIRGHFVKKVLKSKFFIHTSKNYHYF